MWKMKFICVFMLSFLLSASSLLYASRMYLPAGQYVKKSELIVVVDTKKSAESYDKILTVSEVIKGDKEYLGKTIVLPANKLRSTADAWVPDHVKGVAVLFPPNWEGSEEWPVLEVYQSEVEIEALRILVDILNIKDERKRILSLRKAMVGGNKSVIEQFFEELRLMKDPDNYDILISSYDNFSEVNQEKLVKHLDGMNDLQGVPILIKALSSPSKQVSAAGAHGLYYNYPGAPGVSEAFKNNIHSEGVEWFASRYLAKRTNDLKYEDVSKPKTRWQRAQKFEDEGQLKEARVLYFELIADEKEDDYSRRQSAIKLLKDANKEEKDRIRVSILPLMQKDVISDNYIWLLEATQILRALNHLDGLPSLIKVLEYNEAVREESAREATMAIRELGREAREEAVQKVLELLQSPPKEHPTGNNPSRFLLELAWLADEKTFQEAKDTMHENNQYAWQNVESLQPLTVQDDEVLFLMSLMSELDKIPHGEVRNWIIFRLGDLKDKRAIPSLVSYLDSVNDTRLLANAFKSIGGTVVEEEMIKLLSHSELRIRELATEVLLSLQGDKALPLCRRMVKEKNFGEKNQALTHLYYHGTLDDLEMLKPLCDNWNGDRSYMYWSCHAMTGIRERFNYDINGPIESLE